MLRNAGRLTEVATLRNPMLQGIRNTVARFATGFPFVQHKMANQLTEMDIGYPESPLTVRDGDVGAGPKAGERWPERLPAGAGGMKFVAAGPSDVTAALAAKYPQLVVAANVPGPHAAGLRLIRPDGYVGYAGSAKDPLHAEAYLVDPGGGLKGTTLPADTLLLLIDAVGTFAFALSGGALAVQKRFDIFGVLFLAFLTAVTGGVARDVLIGAVPPVAIAHWRSFAIALAGGLATFFGYPLVSALKRPVLLLDAIGLGLFAVTGAQKALIYGIDPVMAAALGMLSGIGGGMVRDLLAGEVPSVLRTDIYAVAALAAGGVVALGDVLGVAAGLVDAGGRRAVHLPADHGDLLRLACAGGALAGVGSPRRGDRAPNARMSAAIRT